ncbi:type IV pilin protein [Candidatus Avelusimicrobium sp.]
MKNVSEAILKPLKQKLNSRCQKDKTREDAEQKHLSMTSCFNKGFTLIELLVVVLIIGILSAVALPQYQKSVMKARAVQAMVTLNALEKAQDEYYLANGTYTTNLEDLSIDVKKKPFPSCHISESGKYCSISINEITFEVALSPEKTPDNRRCMADKTSQEEIDFCKSFGGRLIMDHAGMYYYAF